MARSSRARSAGGASKSKATSRKSAPAPVAEVEVVEEKKGMGIDDGIPLMTAVLLLTAFLLVDYLRGSHFDEGMFF